MRSLVCLVLAAALVVPAAGCARRQKKLMQELEAPPAVDCNTAEGDIRMLEHEKAHVAERIAEGVTAIHPAGLVIGLVTRTEGTKVKVAIGDIRRGNKPDIAVEPGDIIFVPESPF